MSQVEANQLIGMSKEFVQDAIPWPEHGKKISYTIKSKDETQNFIVDINNLGRIELRSLTFQNRYTKEIILIRADFGRKQHANPDDTIISGNHIHIYREGFGTSWAYEMSKIPQQYMKYGIAFTSSNEFDLFSNFCVLCNIDNTGINLSF